MGSASRVALEAAKQQLAAADGVTLAPGEHLPAAGRTIGSSVQLRSTLSAPSVEGSRKSALLTSIFGSLDGTASTLLDGIVASPWSSQAELLDGIQGIG